MESIKHKMDTMVKEKDAAVEKAVGFEAETGEFEKAASKFEKEVDDIQRYNCQAFSVHIYTVIIQ